MWQAPQEDAHSLRESTSQRWAGRQREELVRRRQKLQVERDREGGRGLCLLYSVPRSNQRWRRTHLDAVLLQVQVAGVDRDAGRHLRQLPPCADHPAGLVAAGAGCWAGGGWWGPSSSSCGHGYTAPTGSQGWGKEPQEQKSPVGPGHPTRRQQGTQGTTGVCLRHSQCSYSEGTLGGCGRREDVGH